MERIFSYVVLNPVLFLHVALIWSLLNMALLLRFVPLLGFVEDDDIVVFHTNGYRTILSQNKDMSLISSSGASFHKNEVFLLGF